MSKCCEVEGCDKPRRARGVCDHHYHRLTTYGAVDAQTATEQHAAAQGRLPDDGIIDDVAVDRAIAGEPCGFLTARERDLVILALHERGVGSEAIAAVVNATEWTVNERLFRLERRNSDNGDIHCGCAAGTGATAGCCLPRDMAVRPSRACHGCFFAYQLAEPVAHSGCAYALPGAVEAEALSA